MTEEKPYYTGPHGATMRCKVCHKYWPDRCTCKRPFVVSESLPRPITNHALDTGADLQPRRRY